MPVEVIAYDHDNEAHQGFVFDAIVQDAGEWPYEGQRRQDLRVRFHQALRHCDTRCEIAWDPEESAAIGSQVLLGFACVSRGVIVQCYVRHMMRQVGLATQLLARLGIDTKAAPVPLLFWTPAARTPRATSCAGGPRRSSWGAWTWWSAWTGRWLGAGRGRSSFGGRRWRDEGLLHAP